MSGESKILPLVAVVVGVVACLPSACCLAFYGLGSLATLVVDPRMIESAAGSGPVPSRLTFVALGAGSTVGALVAVALGVAGLVWGVRALRRASS
jgi:hypothetical protein